MKVNEALNRVQINLSKKCQTMQLSVTQDEIMMDKKCTEKQHDLTTMMPDTGQGND